MKVIPMEESALRRAAKIFGENSTAAHVLAEAERRRSRGEAVAFFRGTGKHARVIIVADPIDATPSEDSAK